MENPPGRKKYTFKNRKRNDDDGVYRSPQGKWTGYFVSEKKQYSIGTYDTKEAAVAARATAVADPKAAVAANAQRKVDRKPKPTRRIATGIRQIANRYEVTMGAE